MTGPYQGSVVRSLGLDTCHVQKYSRQREAGTFVWVAVMQLKIRLRHGI